MAGNPISNVKSEFGARIVHIVTSGLLLLLLTRILGPDGYGLLALAIAVFTFSRFLSESGLHWSAARYIAEYKDERPDKAATVVIESRRFVVVAATLVSIGLILLSEPLASILDEPSLSPLLIAGAGVVFFYSLHRFNRHILQGYEDITTSATIHSVEGILTLGFVSAFVLYRPTPLAAIIGYVLAYGVSALIGIVAVSEVGNLRGPDLVDRPTLRRKVLRYNVPLSATRLSNVVDKQMDVILVGYFLTSTAVGFYALGKQIADFVRVPAASIGFALSPTYGSEKAKGNVEGATAVFEESLRNTLIFYVPACAGIVVIADSAIPTVFGGEYTGAVVVVQILAVFIFFDSFIKITGPGLDYLGRARTRAIANAITSTGNIVLNVLLIPLIGVAGAAIATVIATGIYSLISLYIMYTELAFDVRKTARCLSKVTIITVVMAGTVSLFLGYLGGYVAVAVSVSVGTGIWLGACHLFDLFDVRAVYVQFQG